MRSPTLGGRMVWSDRMVSDDGRVQVHALTGHARLLDPKGRRILSGSLEECLRDLAGRGPAHDPDARPVILVHGLGRTRTSMRRLQRGLEDALQRPVLTIGYPSTRADLDTHARACADVLRRLPGGAHGPADFVTHSLGGILVRCVLVGDLGWHPGRRVRVVMLAPPNRGSRLLAGLRRAAIGPIRLALGPVGAQLTPAGVARVPVPPRAAAEVGVVAAVLPLLGRRTPWGPSDGIVAVDETHLPPRPDDPGTDPGEDDRVLVRHSHSLIMNAGDVIEHTATFLREGRFARDARRDG